VVLYAGRLRTRKAVAVLLEAFARMRRAHPGAALVLAGDGEQRPALEAQACRLGIDRAVRFAGARPRDAMAAEYAAADLFCLPSLYEGFPLAILEAMAAGLPVVATAVAGVPEAVADGVTGRLVPPEDADALARALAELAADRERARRMGEAGRRRIEADFDISTVAGAYLELWRGLLDAG
jgi:glycosyltransferase involved in cell wall biosynthesis